MLSLFCSITLVSNYHSVVQSLVIGIWAAGLASSIAACSIRASTQDGYSQVHGCVGRFVGL